MLSPLYLLDFYQYLIMLSRLLGSGMEQVLQGFEEQLFRSCSLSILWGSCTSRLQCGLFHSPLPSVKSHPRIHALGILSLRVSHLPPNRCCFTWVCVPYPNYDSYSCRLMSCCRSDLLRRLAPTYRFLFWSMLASVFLRYSVFRCDAYASFCFLGICCLHRAGVVDLAIVSAASEHSAFVQVLPCVSGTHSLCATEVIKLRNSDAVFSVL